MKRVLGLLILSLFLLPLFVTPTVSASPTVLERGVNYVISDLGGGKRSWESAPQWVSDGSQYVPYIYSRDEAKKCYNVQVGFVAARIYDTGIVEIYDPALSEVRVKGESWEVWSAGKQATLVAPITWGVVTNSSGVFITRRQTTSKPDGVLTIDYIFRVGSSLKHTVTWTSTGVVAVTVQVKQVHLMDFDKVTTDTGTATDSKSEKSAGYLFGYGSKDFWVLEDQSAMVYDAKSLEPGTLLTEKCLQSGDIDFAGKKAVYTFGDWTLTTGQSLEIDPDTATLNDPTEDGWINYQPALTRNTSGSDLDFGGYGASGAWIVDYRAYCEWPISSLSGATLTANPIFKYEGLGTLASDEEINPMAAQPSTATDANLYADIASGTAYVNPFGLVVGTNQQVDLGATAKSDLQAAIGASQTWFAIGFQSPANE